jgi:hypothetical protein
VISPDGPGSGGGQLGTDCDAWEPRLVPASLAARVEET